MNERSSVLLAGSTGEQEHGSRQKQRPLPEMAPRDACQGNYATGEIA